MLFVGKPVVVRPEPRLPVGRLDVGSEPYALPLPNVLDLPKEPFVLRLLLLPKTPLVKNDVSNCIVLANELFPESP